MLKELRKLDKTDKTKSRAIRQAQNRGKLPLHTNEQGYACYDTDEYKEYKKTTKRGRPVKQK